MRAFYTLTLMLLLASPIAAQQQTSPQPPYDWRIWGSAEAQRRPALIPTPTPHEIRMEQIQQQRNRILLEQQRQQQERERRCRYSPDRCY